LLPTRVVDGMGTRIVLVKVLLVVLPACGPSVEDDDAGRASNFPLPALTDCGALPEGVVPIAALTSAYVVTGPRPVVNEFITPDDDVGRLRLSSIALAADDPAAPDPLSDDCGPEGWAFAFDIPPEYLVPGVHALGEITPSHRESMDIEGDGCFGGDGNARGDDLGELEIFTVTADCVTGEIRGAADDGATLIRLRNGGFVAQREAVECVPLAGHHDCE
jgi:hypothetical protein